jgi:hypothetical protein
MRVILLWALSVVVAVGAVDIPSAGYARTADGSVVRVSGVAGAFLTGATDQTESISASFSGRLGVVKLASTVRVLDAGGAVVSESDAPEGAGLFGFNARGDAAIAYYASTQTLAVFRTGEWHPLPVDTLAMTVLAVALQDSETALALVTRDRLSLVTLRISDGAVMDETVLGDGTGPALLLPDRGAIFVRDDALLYHAADGSEQVIQALSGSGVTLSRMDSDWIHARLESGRNLVFRLEQDPRVYELPGVPQ